MTIRLSKGFKLSFPTEVFGADFAAAEVGAFGVATDFALATGFAVVTDFAAGLVFPEAFALTAALAFGAAFAGLDFVFDLETVAAFLAFFFILC